MTSGVDGEFVRGPPGVVDQLRRICGTAERALFASGVGMSVATADGTNGMTVASDPTSERLEELQFTLGEGPCVDAFTTRRPVLVAELDSDAMSRWPVYAPALRDAGVRAVFAFPLQVGAARLGVLDVFRAHPGPLSRIHLGQALTFADLAVATLLDGQERATAGADGLDGAMEYGAELFQAQGMVMIQLGVTLTEALARLRAHAYAEDRRLTEVAADVVARRLCFDRDQQ